MTDHVFAVITKKALFVLKQIFRLWHTDKNIHKFVPQIDPGSEKYLLHLGIRLFSALGYNQHTCEFIK